MREVMNYHEALFVPGLFLSFGLELFGGLESANLGLERERESSGELYRADMRVHRYRFVNGD